MTSLVYPLPQTYPVNQPYGPTGVGAEPSGHGYAHWHAGVDLGCPTDTPVLAAAAGTVLYAGSVPDSGPNNNAAQYYFFGFGTMVLLDHGGGVWTLYGHLHSCTVTTGQGVQQGQEVALSNNTGNSQGAHLHFGVYTNNGQTDDDPGPYLTGMVIAPSQSTGVATYAQVIYWARQAGIPEDQLATCAAIAMAESGLRINAENSIGACGLWQILHSAHPQYDVNGLLTDPQYNAVAMAAISSTGTDWTPWETYTSNHARQYLGPGQGFYRDYLAAAQAAVAANPKGTVPASTDPAQAAFGTVPQFSDSTPVDTTPQLPAQQVRITAVAVNPGDLVPRPNAQSRAVLWVAGYEVPLIDVSITEPTFRAPGSWTGTLHTDAFTIYPGLLDVLEAQEQTQVIIYGGWIPGPPDTSFTIDQLEALFTGLVDPPKIDYRNRTVSLSGPDLMGIFNNPSATLSQLYDSWVNAYASSVVKAIVQRHNTKNGGLSADVDQSAIWAGQAFDQQTRTSRQQGQTEYDVMTALAAAEGYALWADGTTIKYKRWPQDSDPITLEYAVTDEPASAVTNVVITYGKHAKRAYSIQTTAFDRASGGQITSDLYGNHDSLDTIVYPMPAGTRKKALDQKAASLYQQYLATQLVADISIQGAVRLRPEQPITLRSDLIDPRFTGPHRRYWPADIGLAYGKGKGWGMTVTATNLPPGIQVATANTSAAVGF